MTQSQQRDPAYYCGNFDGIPGLVWYASAEQVRGDRLTAGDWLDSLDHRGARRITAIWVGGDVEDLADITFHDMDHRTVMFAGGETETLRADVLYDVVDPASQVAPDGTPVWEYTEEELAGMDDGLDDGEY